MFISLTSLRGNRIVLKVSRISYIEYMYEPGKEERLTRIVLWDSETYLVVKDTIDEIWDMIKDK